MTGIDSGQTGIIVNLAGSERGVDDGEGGGGITEGASQYPWIYVYQHTVVRETMRTHWQLDSLGKVLIVYAGTHK